MKLLLADDDPVTRDTLKRCVESEGFVAVMASDGREALDLWREHRPDLLCLDVMMPHIDGYEVCRRVRAVDAEVPVLFLSAKSEEVDVVVGLRLGADDFVRKPFGKHELLARLRAALRRIEARNRTAKTFCMGSLTVYPKELRAEREGVSIDLSPCEIAILSVLHEHAGEVIDRDTFFNRCWGVNYFPDSRTVDQHIARLRKRIERDPKEPQIIETLRGAGYRYRAAADDGCRQK